MVVCCGRLAVLLFSFAATQATGTPTFSINNSSTRVEVEDNQRLEFVCRVENVTETVLMLYLQEEGGYRRVITNSTAPNLSRSIPAKHDMSGKYVCSATNRDGVQVSTGFVILSVKSRPRHCGTSEYPEVASAIPGDIIVRLCAFANPRPKLSAVSKGNQPSRSDLLLVNFKYTDTSRNRGDFIIAIANATEEDLGFYSLVAFANNLESTLRFKLVASSSKATESGLTDIRDVFPTTVIVAIVLACLLLLVVTILVIVCWQRSREKATFQDANQLLYEVPVQLEASRELRPVESPETACVEAVGAAAKAEEFLESTDEDYVDTDAIFVANNENVMYSKLGHMSETDEQPEYLQFTDQSDQPLYNNVTPEYVNG